MTCKAARFYSNESLLWFPFQQNTFGNLHCRELPLPVGGLIIKHIGQRFNLQKNWNTANYITSTLIPQTQQHTLHIDPIQSDIILTASKDEIIEWDIKNQTQFTQFKIPSGCTDFCVDKTRIYVSSNDAIRVYERLNKNVSYDINNLFSNVNRMKISPKYLVVGLWDGTIHLIEPSSGNILAKLSGHRSPIHSIDIQKQLIVSGSSDRSIKLWNLRGANLSTLMGHTRTITSLQLINNASRLFSGSRDHLVRLWDIQLTVCASEFRAHTAPVSAVSFRGENILVSGGADKQIFLWDIRKPNPIHTLRGHNSEIVSLEIDEQRIVSCSSDKTIISWDFAKLT